jgi:hypothetical protein
MIGPTHPADQLAEAQAIVDAQDAAGDGPDATRGEDDSPIEHKGDPIPDDVDNAISARGAVELGGAF